MKSGDKVKIVLLGSDFNGKFVTLKNLRSRKLWETSGGWFWERDLRLVEIKRGHPLTDFFKK